jgi:hypothetical protein
MSLSTNLLAYYKFDETSGTTASDEEDYTDLTATNARIFTREAGGKLGDNGADFTGGNDYLSSGNNFFRFTDGTDDLPHSFSFWVKPANTTQTAGLFCRFRTPTVNTYIEYWIGFYLSRIYTQYYDQTAGASNSIGRYCSATGLSTSEFNHVVITYDGSGTSSGIKIYIAGEEVTTTDFSNSTYNRMDLNDDKIPFTIGARLGTGPIYFDGVIDEVAIFDDVISSSEVSELYNDGAGLAYPFSEGPGPEPSVKRKSLFMGGGV